MKAILAFIVTVSSLSSAYATCPGDTTSNSFSMLAEDVNSLTVSFSGSGPNTVAYEILGYMQKAGAAGGVVMTNETLPNPPDVSVLLTDYKAGNFVVTLATQGNMCPPLDVEITKTTSVWPLWRTSLARINGTAYIQVVPASDDALTLANLMAAAGIVGVPAPNAMLAGALV